MTYARSDGNAGVSLPVMSSAQVDSVTGFSCRNPVHCVKTNRLSPRWGTRHITAGDSSGDRVSPRASPFETTTNPQWLTPHVSLTILKISSSFLESLNRWSSNNTWIWNTAWEWDALQLQEVKQKSRSVCIAERDVYSCTYTTEAFPAENYEQRKRYSDKWLSVIVGNKLKFLS